MKTSGTEYYSCRLIGYIAIRLALPIMLISFGCEKEAKETGDGLNIDSDTNNESDAETGHGTESDTIQTDSGEDQCPDDTQKTQPGVCGCGVPDTDGDGDGTPDCNDHCPEDPAKNVPGLCGCGKAEGACDTGSLARWTFLVFMNGDNNLESMVTGDLNELEEIGSGDGIHVVVQADRIKGYSTDDGDWTNTRRYYITRDDDMRKVSSAVVEDLPELDMGNPGVLSDFVMWAHKKYPAERMALVMWNHGDSWRSTRREIARSISDDETSDSTLSIANGDMITALEEIVAARGPLDLVAFDACLMASWEVAHSLKGYAHYMAGSEALVFSEGYNYGDALSMLRSAVENADGADLADRMARGAVQLGKESTHSAIDIGALTKLNQAIDLLGEAVLSNASLKSPLLDARKKSRGADADYNNWYLDLNDFGAALSQSSNSVLEAHGNDIMDGIDTAVLSAYGRAPYAWTGGLTIMFDYEYSPSYLTKYAGGTWGKATSWDDLLMWLSVN